MQLKKAKTKLYNSYDEALKDCTNDAYENNELVNVVAEKTIRYSNELDSMQAAKLDQRMSYMATSVLYAKQNHEVRVLDFGGACGAHYFEMRKLLPSDLMLHWTVVETPAMVKAAKKLENRELHFEADLDKAVNDIGEIDIIYTSGTIQCVDDPEAYLQKLVDCGARYMMFNRLGLNDDVHNIIVIHESMLSWNGVGSLPQQYKDKRVRYPFQFISAKKFHDIILEKYIPVYECEETSGILPVNKEKLIGKAVLFKRKGMH